MRHANPDNASDHKESHIYRYYHLLEDDGYRVTLPHPYLWNLSYFVYKQQERTNKIPNGHPRSAVFAIR